MSSQPKKCLQHHSDQAMPERQERPFSSAGTIQKTSRPLFTTTATATGSTAADAGRCKKLQSLGTVNICALTDGL